MAEGQVDLVYERESPQLVYTAAVVPDSVNSVLPWYLCSSFNGV